MDLLDKFQVLLRHDRDVPDTDYTFRDLKCGTKYQFYIQVSQSLSRRR